MKKLLFTILFLLIALPVNAKMLYEYGSFSERAEMAVEYGLISHASEYRGDYNTNTALLSYLEQNALESNFGASIQPAALATYNLAGSGVNSSASSITLQSLTLPQNDYAIQDSDLSDTFYITLEPGSRTRQEIASCTTVTQNAGGTATLSGCTRGLSPITPFTASTSLRFSHAGGSQVIFSDPPQLFNAYPAKANDESITGDWGYSIIPSSTDECTETDEFCTKTYIDNSVNQGAATSTEVNAGICELATQAETAAGTDLGITSPLCLQAKYASSTGEAATTSIVVTEADGNINQEFLGLEDDFTFSGETEITSLTISSTTINTYATASTSVTSKGYVDDNDVQTFISSVSISTTTSASDGVSISFLQKIAVIPSGANYSIVGGTVVLRNNNNSAYTSGKFSMSCSNTAGTQSQTLGTYGQTIEDAPGATTGIQVNCTMSGSDMTIYVDFDNFTSNSHDATLSGTAYFYR